MNVLLKVKSFNTLKGSPFVTTVSLQRLSDNQESNWQAVVLFEPYIERLDEEYQLICRVNKCQWFIGSVG